MSVKVGAVFPELYYCMTESVVYLESFIWVPGDVVRSISIVC